MKYPINTGILSFSLYLLKRFFFLKDTSHAFVRPCPDLGIRKHVSLAEETEVSQGLPCLCQTMSPDLGIRKHVSPAEEAEVSVGGLPSGGRSCAQVTRPQSFLASPGKGPKLCLPDGLPLGTKDFLTEARKDME